MIHRRRILVTPARRWREVTAGAVLVLMFSAAIWGSGPMFSASAHSLDLVSASCRDAASGQTEIIDETGAFGTIWLYMTLFTPRNAPKAELDAYATQLQTLGFSGTFVEKFPGTPDECQADSLSTTTSTASSGTETAVPICLEPVPALGWIVVLQGPYANVPEGIAEREAWRDAKLAEVQAQLPPAWIVPLSLRPVQFSRLALPGFRWQDPASLDVDSLTPVPDLESTPPSSHCDDIGTSVVEETVEGVHVKLRTAPDPSNPNSTWVCVSATDGNEHFGGKAVINTTAPGVNHDSNATQCQDNWETRNSSQRVEVGPANTPVQVDVNETSPGETWVCLQADTVGVRVIVQGTPPSQASFDTDTATRDP